MLRAAFHILEMERFDSQFCADRSRVFLEPFKGELQCLPQSASPKQDPATEPLPLRARP